MNNEFLISLVIYVEDYIIVLFYLKKIVWQNNNVETDTEGNKTLFECMLRDVLASCFLVIKWV